MTAAADAPSLPIFVTAEQRWNALQTRDRRADGAFVYAVKTTGVYCRPSSGARLPRRDNVVFFDDAQAAEAAGYRVSKRADRSTSAAERARLAAAACRAIDDAETPPSLAALATQAGLSPYHFHRLFKSVTGLTPRGYAAARRGGKVRAQLAHRPGTAASPSTEASAQGPMVHGDSTRDGRGRTGITQAIYDAGFQSNSRFYASSDRMLGMTPSDYRRGGTRATIRFAIAQCTLGAILVAQSERGVCAILLGDDPQALACDFQDQFPHATLIGNDAAYERVVAQVVGFVEAPETGLDLPLDIQGTAFQQRVWDAIASIPCGKTATYTDIAERIGQPSAARAVAAACGANRLAIAIPCHRVVRRDDGPSGYRWGVDRKQQILARENLSTRNASTSGTISDAAE